MKFIYWADHTIRGPGDQYSVISDELFAKLLPHFNDLRCGNFGKLDEATSDEIYELDRLDAIDDMVDGVTDFVDQVIEIAVC